MSALALTVDEPRDRLGLKGPRAAEWLVQQGMVLPMTPNTWACPGEAPDVGDLGGNAVGGNAVGGTAVLVARLGAAEFFLEDGAGGSAIKRMTLEAGALSGVYPLLREDWAFELRGEGVHEVLSQVCNVNFAALALDSRPLIMTMMIGVAVLVVPRTAVGERRYRIWCDPTFGPYMSESLGAVVVEHGGRYTGDLQ